MRWISLGVLLLTACPGSPGELGQGTFEYSCVGPADPYCDCDEHPTFCTGGSASIEAYPNHQVPEAIAVGATFRVQFEAEHAYPEVISAAPAMLSEGDELQALAPGEVGIMGLLGGRVLDFMHLTLVTPTAVRVDRLDTGTGALTELHLEPGETAWLRALPMHGGRVLHGHLPCSWSTSHDTAIGLDTIPGDNVVGLTAWVSTTDSMSVTVTLGELIVPLAVTVSHDPGLGTAGGAP